MGNFVTSTLASIRLTDLFWGLDSDPLNMLGDNHQRNQVGFCRRMAFIFAETLHNSYKRLLKGV